MIYLFISYFLLLIIHLCYIFYENAHAIRHGGKCRGSFHQFQPLRSRSKNYISISLIENNSTPLIISLAPKPNYNFQGM